MTDNHWAIFALCDIRNALNSDEYEYAVEHIDQAISAMRLSVGAEMVSLESHDKCSVGCCIGKT